MSEQIQTAKDPSDELERMIAQHMKDPQINRRTALYRIEHGTYEERRVFQAAHSGCGRHRRGSDAFGPPPSR